MRRTRFRAWHTEEKKMYSDPLINGLTGEVCIYDQGEITGVYDIETVIPLQYTGLKDKNGTEIFEGDILLHHTLRKKIIVEFDCKTLYRVSDFSTDYIEVIGNTYENPDLLERSQIG